jgi:hypothetical protein
MTDPQVSPAPSTAPPEPPPMPDSAPTMKPPVEPVDNAALVDSLIRSSTLPQNTAVVPPYGQSTVQTVSVAGAQDPSAGGIGQSVNTKKKGSKVGILLAVVILLLVTLPIGIYYISKKDVRLTDNRSQAAACTICADGESFCQIGNNGELSGFVCNCLLGFPETSGGKCDYNCGTKDVERCPVPGGLPDPEDFSCKDHPDAILNGRCIEPKPGHTISVVNHYKCPGNPAPNTSPIPTPAGCSGNPTTYRNVTTPICFEEGYCGTQQIDAAGGPYLCFISTYECLPSPTDQPADNTSTPTPSSTPIPGQCTRIKVYKDEASVDPSTLKVGDVIQIAVAGTNATKGRIRVNGGDWTETDVKNGSGEYYIAYTVPSILPPNYTIEAEVLTNGEWK